jgi:lipopolysaccharide/colanic/teichoic acid biosynthesis glycosyltransferase
MLMQSRSVTYPRARTWNRVRIQLGGGLVFAVFLPALLLRLLSPDLALGSLIDQTTLGMTAGVALSLYLLRNISFFPGIRMGYFILPAVLIGYGIVFSTFLFLRLDYSRILLLSGFVAELMWLYLVDYLARRESQLRIGVVPFGDVETLNQIPDMEWAWLSAPDLAGDRVDAVVADLRADLPDQWEAFVADSALNGTAVFHVKQLREALTGRVEIEHLSENSFGSLIPFMAYLRLRRFIDFVSALVVGLLLLPFLLLVGWLVRLDSPGPALYRQARIGYRGERFVVTKFRTMHHARREEDPRLAAITQDSDARVTRLGRFLRRSRIDELPQIWNVLKGDMSWIGPRPEADVLSSWYEAELPFYRYRHIVPPGITGWAQVNQGHVADLQQVNSKLHYDFYYIKNFSPWLDALIVVKTIQIVFSGFGSR